jgi:hypothetical protein
MSKHVSRANPKLFRAVVNETQSSDWRVMSYSAINDGAAIDCWQCLQDFHGAVLFCCRHFRFSFLPDFPAG